MWGEAHVVRACETSIFIGFVTIPTILAGLFNLSPENPGWDRWGRTVKLSRPDDKGAAGRRYRYYITQRSSLPLLEYLAFNRR